MFSSLISDFEIRNEAVAGSLENPVSQGVLWQAAQGEFLLNVPGVSRYRVSAGRMVSIDRTPGVAEGEVDRFFRLTPWAALLFQRGVMALHAAAVSNGREAIVIAGDSGAGKSTLLAELLRRGWAMLADEVAVVDVDAGGKPVVYPTESTYVLWPDAAEHFGITTSRACTVSAQGPDVAAPQALRAFCWLQLSNKDEIQSVTLHGTERFVMLNRALYNTQIADALLDRTQYLPKAMAMVQTACMHLARRPRSGWTVQELADLVEEQAR